MRQRFTLLSFRNREFRIFRSFVAVLAAALLWGGEVYAFGKEKSPEEYGKSVGELFAREAWNEGMDLLKEGLKLYPESAELNGLAGEFYFGNRITTMPVISWCGPSRIRPTTWRQRAC